MIPWKFGLGLLLGPCLLLSCQTLELEQEADDAPPPGFVPDFLSSGSGNSGGGTLVGGEKQVKKLDFTGLVFTDPDNWDAPIPELDGTFHSEVVDTWDDSYTRAKETALRNERPLLMWFTDSERSPICKRLEAEVWQSNEFKELVNERVVRVKFDFNVTQGDSSQRYKKKKYLEGLKKQYKALGLPNVVVLTADGQFVHRERGYTSGQGEYYYQNLRVRIEQAEKQYQATKARLKEKGYRNWKAGNGTRLFAKPVALREDRILLQRVDKKRVPVKLKALSPKDQAWVRTQSARSGS